MTNDELLAEADEMTEEDQKADLISMVRDLAAALRASEEAHAKTVNALADAVRQGLALAVREQSMGARLNAAENVIRKALEEAVDLFGPDAELGGHLHRILSSYKPEEGKN